METKQVLTALRLPARLTVEEAAVLLGFHPDAISVLVKAKMLEPLAGYDRDAITECTGWGRLLFESRPYQIFEGIEK